MNPSKGSSRALTAVYRVECRVLYYSPCKDPMQPFVAPKRAICDLP